MNIFFEKDNGEQFKLVLEDETMIDCVLDQLNIGCIKYITEDLFKVQEPTKIDLYDNNFKIKIGEIIHERLRVNV